MAQYGWANCPEPVRTQIEEFTGAVRRILVDNLLGVYLHGSLAMDCFNPERSDVDILVVTRQGMAVETKRAIAELLLRYSSAPRPIEISFLHTAQLRPWAYPTPFDLHYGEGWREKYASELASGAWRQWNTVVHKDPDLAAHVTITRARGVCLYGAPILAVFPPVPRRDYLASILGDVRDALERLAEDPVYGVLNICRVYWYLCEGRICSKEEAGAWAARTLPDEFQGVVTQALEIYRGTRADAPFDAEALAGFAAYMDGAIKTVVPI